MSVQRHFPPCQALSCVPFATKNPRSILLATIGSWLGLGFSLRAFAFLSANKRFLTVQLLRGQHSLSRSSSTQRPETIGSILPSGFRLLSRARPNALLSYAALAKSAVGTSAIQCTGGRTRITCNDRRASFAVFDAMWQW